jgi:hypothetical protein
VLLATTLTMLVGILFGMIVRERELPAEDILVPAVGEPSLVRRPISTAPVPVVSAPDPAPASAEPEEQSPPAPTVRVREVRHWEEAVPATMDELQSGWTRTWPTTVKSSDATTTPRRTGRDLRSELRSPSKASEQEVVRNWLNEDQRSTSEDE